jgi:hypothetical protein
VTTTTGHDPATDPDTGTWTRDERDLHTRLLNGETVVVNMRAGGHKNLWTWAERAGHAVRIDRRSPWGNPRVIAAGHDRDDVCDWYANEYWPTRPDLAAEVHTLRGKALGCWCAPARCHGDHLAALTENDLANTPSQENQ